MTDRILKTNHDRASIELQREYRLIFALNLELIIIGILFVIVNIYLDFQLITAILSGGVLLATINFIVLIRKKSVIFTAYAICTICLFVAVLGNLFLGGITSSYLDWFYVIPILAATTLGMQGLVIYSLLSVTCIMFFVTQSLIPAYFVTGNFVIFINIVNHASIFTLIFTVMYHLIREYEDYESFMRSQNTQLEADRQKFHYLSNHDALTQLPNRIYFHNYLDKAMNELDTDRESLTLFFMDLDDFKTINDVYGHEVGDKLLIQAGKRLKSCFRGKDLVARYGGDEFVALISHKRKEAPQKRLEFRIQAEFETPFNINDRIIASRISIGSASYPDNSSNADELLKLADQAMYEDKKANSQGSIDKFSTPP